jgi:hypothetical protein
MGELLAGAASLTMTVPLFAADQREAALGLLADLGVAKVSQEKRVSNRTRGNHTAVANRLLE